MEKTADGAERGPCFERVSKPTYPGDEFKRPLIFIFLSMYTIFSQLFFCLRGNFKIIFSLKEALHKKIFFFKKQTYPICILSHLQQEQSSQWIGSRSM